MRNWCSTTSATTSHVVSAVSAVATVSASHWCWVRVVCGIVSLALQLMLVDGTYSFEE